MSLPLAHDRLAELLPLPWRRGAERLGLTVGANGANGANFIVRAYDFSEYRARHGEDPAEPRAVIFPLQDVGRVPIALTLRRNDGAGLRRLAAPLGSADRLVVLDPPIADAPPFQLQIGEEVVRCVGIVPGGLDCDRGLVTGVPARPHPAGTPVRRRGVSGGPIRLTVPAGLGAGESLALPAAPLGTAARLLNFTASPPGSVTGVTGWGISYLLGNVAKLAWVLGREKDTLRRLHGAVGRARHITTAAGRSLDRLGADLSVPRFPPRPHAVDDATILLLHLDDAPAIGADFADAVADVRPPGLPAENRGAAGVSGGRFSGGARTGAAGGLSVADDPALDPAAGDFSAECFVRLEAAPGPFALLLGKGPHAADGSLSGAGWSLGLGTFRGFEANPRFALSDGAASRAVFADRALPQGVWVHVAGVVERAAGRAALFLDGREVASVSLGPLGALTNARPLEIGAVEDGGPPVHTLPAILDEVRLSSLARAHFGPATGEADEAYRTRLALFRRWWRPSPEGLTEALNRAGPVAGDPAPFVIDETDVPVAIAPASLRLLPDEIPSGATLSADGRSGGPSPSAVEPDFAPWMLTEPAASPALLLGGPAARTMQVGPARKLEALAALTAGGPNPLRVLAARRADGPPLARLGREIEVAHADIAPPRLAALAHTVGFAEVMTGADRVTLREGPGPRAGLVPEAAPVEGTALLVGDLLPVHLDPVPGAGTRAAWSVVPGAAGRAAIELHPADPPAGRPAAERPRIGLRALAPGLVALRGEIERGGLRLSAVTTLRIGLDTLPDGTEIDAEGRTGAAGSLDGPAPVPAFTERFLHRHEPAPVLGDEPTYAAPAVRRMLLPLRVRLDALLRLIDAGGDAISGLTIASGFDPAGERPFAEGRALTLTHATLAPARLAALAHNAGFKLVRNVAGVVTVIAEAAPLVGVEAVGSPGAPLPDSIAVGDTIELTPTLPADADGRDVSWEIGSGTPPAARLDARTRPEVTLTAERAGRAGLRLVVALREEGRTHPFAFAVRLKPALDVPGTVIPKDVYDVAMNVLSHFGPIGVAIDTASIRARVVELQGGASPLPRYTFPDFKGT